MFFRTTTVCCYEQAFYSYSAIHTDALLFIRALEEDRDSTNTTQIGTTLVRKEE